MFPRLRSMPKLFTIVAGLLLSLSLLPACSLLSSLGGVGTTANTAAQLVVEESTALAIQSGCAATATVTAQQCYDLKAARVLKIAQALQGVTAGTAVAQVQILLANAIAGLKLSPEESTPLVVLTTAILTYLTPLLGNTVITAPGFALVSQVASWVGQVAAEYSPTPAAKAGFKARFVLR